MAVRLDRITTRTGDDGTTALADGTRLPKDHPLIAAIGEVDAANALIGMVRLQQLPERVATAAVAIQNDLFDLGADLASPPGSAHEEAVPRIDDDQVRALERLIEEGNAALPPLRSFVLPGGGPSATWLHLARVQARAAERACVLAREPRQPACHIPSAAVMHYLNRLSDLLFVWSRLCARAGGAPEELWVPRSGRARGASP